MTYKNSSEIFVLLMFTPHPPQAVPLPLEGKAVRGKILDKKSSRKQFCKAKEFWGTGANG